MRHERTEPSLELLSDSFLSNQPWIMRFLALEVQMYVCMSHFLQLHQNLIDDMDDHMSFMVYMTYMVKKKIKSQPGVFETCFVNFLT